MIIKRIYYTQNKERKDFIKNYIDTICNFLRLSIEEKEYILELILNPTVIKLPSEEVINRLYEVSLILKEGDNIYLNPEIFGLSRELEKCNSIEITFKHQFVPNLK
jgi:hypothetical protein